MNPSTRLLTIAAASTGLLVVSPLANASVSPPAAAASSTAAGDVLFWSRSTASTPGSYIVKASAASPTPSATVVPGTAAAALSGPEVSPDGTRLAYVKDTYVLVPNGNPILTTNLVVRVLATGSTTVLVTGTGGLEDGVHVREPTWSPNGQAIAYEEVVHGPNSEYPTVRVVPAAGGPSRLIEAQAVAAAWRPDGNLSVARFDPATGSSPGLWITGATPADAVLIPGSAGALRSCVVTGRHAGRLQQR